MTHRCKGVLRRGTVKGAEFDLAPEGRATREALREPAQRRPRPDELLDSVGVPVSDIELGDEAWMLSRYDDFSMPEGCRAHGDWRKVYCGAATPSTATSWSRTRCARGTAPRSTSSTAGPSSAREECSDNNHQNRHLRRPAMKSPQKS